MHIVYIVLASIAALLILLLLTALFVKKDFHFIRSVMIAKPKNEVFNFVKKLANQDRFSKWAMMDPAMKKSYRGTDAAPGFVYSWEGNRKVGKGEQEITAISEGETIDYELRFEKPMKAVSYSTMRTEAIDSDSTKVTWDIRGKMNYPFNLMGLFMNMDKVMGEDLNVGLRNLKELQERGEGA